MPLPARAELDNQMIRQAIRNGCPKASSQLYKAFVPSHLGLVADEIQSLGWRVWDPDVEDIHDEIVRHARSDGRQEPEITTLLLITQVGGFEEIIQELRERKIDVRCVPNHALNSAPLLP